MTQVLMVGNDSSVRGGITSVINQILAHNWVDDGIEMKFISTYVNQSFLRKFLYFAGAYQKIRREVMTPG